MKKIFIAVVLICVLIISVMVIYNIKKDIMYNPEFYKKIEKYSNISDDTFVIQDNIKITLKECFFEKIDKEDLSRLDLNEDEKNKILKDSFDGDFNCLIEISSVNEEELFETTFEYFVYDNKKNPIDSNIGIYNENVPMYYDFYNLFINNKIKPNDVILKMGQNSRTSIIRDELNSILYLVRTEKNPEENMLNLDLSKYHILIVGPTYRNINNQKISLDEKIFEFIIENDK